MEDNTEIKEHDVVKSKVDIVLHGVKLVSIGDKGTVVHHYENGRGYEVEFPKAEGVLVLKREEFEKEV